MRPRRGAFYLSIAGLLVMIGLPASAEEEGGSRRPITREELSPLTALAPTGGGSPNMGQYVNPPNPICTQDWHDGDVYRTDCEGNAPDNETSIAIDPTDTQRILAAGNDYQITANPGSGLGGFAIFTRAMLSEDGGHTWVTHPVPYKSYNATGDPAVAYDADGTAYLATLGFVYSNGGAAFTNPDILVSHSNDGGEQWTRPSVVAVGPGSWMTPGPSQDKEMIAAWGHGNAIVTWTRFLLGKQGSYIQSPIYASVTHDGGKTWTSGVEISGAASFCEGAGPGAARACNQSQYSWPVVAADGSIYVYFLTLDPASNDFDDQVVVVQVSPSDGRRVAGPWRIARIQDGAADYPVSWAGDLTLEDSHFRVGPQGNIAADPTAGDHLAAVWSDMRNSPSKDQGEDQDPYLTETNADVFLSESFDAGRTWSTPTVVGRNPTNDQFYPAVNFLGDGRIVVGMMDRSYDRANHAYAYSLSLRTAGGWQTQNVSGALSDPTKDNRWFTGGAIFPDFPYPTTFIGDYTTVATDGTTARPLWTDLRNDTTFAGRTGHDEQFMETAVRY